jgi:hypothetical protein
MKKEWIIEIRKGAKWTPVTGVLTHTEVAQVVTANSPLCSYRVTRLTDKKLRKMIRR